MKKLLLVISVSLACCINHNINAQAIPDSSFSVWTHTAGSPPYDDPNPTPMTGEGWQDLNFLSQAPFGSPVSVFKDSVNFRSMRASAKIVTVKLSAATISLVGNTLPNDTIGIMFLGVINLPTITNGFPFTNRIANLNFWYEYAPTGIDTGSVYCVLTKWNTVSNKRDTVAGGLFHVSMNVATFQPAHLQMFYTPAYFASGNPDTMQLLASSSTFVHGKANAGSTLHLDDFTLGGTFTGTNAIANNIENIEVYPNPAHNSATFTFSGNSTHILNIFDVTGKKICSNTVNDNTFNLNINNFSEGLYIYQATDKTGKLIQTGKLSVVK